MRNAVFVVCFAVLVAVVGFFGWLGVFSKVHVSENIVGPYTMVYEDYRGDYKNTGKIHMDIYSRLKADGVETFRGFGIYYDVPVK